MPKHLTRYGNFKLAARAERSWRLSLSFHPPFEQDVVAINNGTRRQSLHSKLGRL